VAEKRFFYCIDRIFKSQKINKMLNKKIFGLAIGHSPLNLKTSNTVNVRPFDC
jgi:hypothetical protein